MDRTALFAAIEAYQPVNAQEAADRQQILSYRSRPDIFLRSSEAVHMTASAWVVSKDRTRTLMAYHNLYNSWSWLGGHADGEEDLAQVALREVREESGLTGLRLVTENLYSLEILAVAGHVKKGKYISSHLHLNVTYLIEAEEGEALKVKEDENSALAWFPLQEALKRSTEPWIRDRIYTKLIEKMKLYP